MNKDNIKIVRINNVTDEILLDCYQIANQTRPENAAQIYCTLKQNVNNRGHVLFVCTINEIIYGFIAGGTAFAKNHDEPLTANVEWLFVDVWHHRKGIGRRLLAKCEEHFRANGFKRMTVERAPTIKAKEFYIAGGFMPIAAYKHAKDLSR